MHPQPQLPKTNLSTMNIQDVMEITMRLSNILIEESNLLGAMRVQEIAPLQAEKQKLSQQLTAFQKQLAANDHAVQTAPDSAREELLMLTDDLAFHIEENMRRTAIAQTVNQRVMHTLTEALATKQCASVYGRTGHANNGADITISLNLNERA